MKLSAVVKTAAACALMVFAGMAVPALASEADIKLPDLSQITFSGVGGISGSMLMYIGIGICLIGGFGADADDRFADNFTPAQAQGQGFGLCKQSKLTRR